MSDWIIPFEGRGHSTAVKQNFLWNDGNVYVMDNHRAALWCWLRHLTPGEPVGLCHIDRHTDALLAEKDAAALAGLLAAHPEDSPLAALAELDAKAYLAAGYEGEFFTTVPLFRWDNYIGLFLHALPEAVAAVAFATHGRGAVPAGWEVTELAPWHLPAAGFLGRGRWLVNLDLDYFFYKMAPGDYRSMFGPSYLRDTLLPIRRALESGTAAALTISLSPECCGGWKPAEALCAEICEILGLDFRLP